MELTRENYFSQENQLIYCGSSQIKAFMECESRALAEIKGEYIRPDKNAFIAGQYFDSLFEGNSELFIAQNRDKLFSKKTKKPYAHTKEVDICFERAKRDEEFFRLCSGEQQTIMTGIIQGVPFKIMIDSLHPDMIVDRKAMADFKDKWSDGEYVPWWQTYRYDIQAAIYSEVYEQNRGKRSPFVLAAITKEDEPDLGVFRFTDDTLQNALGEVVAVVEHIQDVKQGRVAPISCGVCDHCRAQKVIKRGEFELI